MLGDRSTSKYHIGLLLALVGALFVAGSCARVRHAGAVLGAKLSPEIRTAIELAVTKVRPALVRIHVVDVRYYGGREIKYEATGSGVIISEEGHVITNHHVAGKAKHIVCTLSSKEEIEAERVGTDPLTDICVLKLRSDGTRKFPFARFGDSSKLDVGDRVLAMGSPLALSQSVTLGIVSNTELVMPGTWGPSEFEIEREPVGSIVVWIGHDAVIFPGNSGGPLVNLAGEIVGINEIRMGLSGAIPSNIARDVADALVDLGKVRRSWIGLELQPLLKASKRETGVLVSGAIENGPGAKAGFQPGDILVTFAGQDVTVRFGEQLPRFTQLVASIPVGEEVEAVVLRDGEEKLLTVVTDERQPAREDTHELKPWGAAIRDISLLDARELQRADTNGVIIDSVRPGGPCDEARPAIIQRDVIVEVNEKPVNSVAELRTITDRITEGQDEPVPATVSFERKTERYMTVVKVGIRKLEQSGLEVRKAWVPVATQVLTRELAEALGIPDRTGVRVTQVYAGTAAENAGLKVGDIIIELDGETIPASYPEDFQVFPTMVRQYKIGSEAELTVLRDNEERKLTIQLPSSPKLEREMEKYRDDLFDFTMRDVGFLDRAREKWDADVAGALVEEVIEGGWAALGELAVGDLVQQVDGEPVADVDAMKTIMEEIAGKKPEYVVFKVLRRIHTIYVEIEPDWDTETETRK
jgi:serine protease Do